MNIIKSHLPDDCYGNVDIDIDGCVIHYISAVNVLPNDPFNFDAIMDIFKQYKVSAHYYIDREGDIFELVPIPTKAYHAGKSIWDGREWCNDFMLGIELAGGKDFGYEPRQIHMLIELLKALIKEHGFSPYNIAGHDAVREAWNITHPFNKGSVKHDPGDHFPWDTVIGELI